MLILSKNSARGFSLIEIVLALGVIAFALVGIMGLFPVAMKSAQESMRETRATLIAQQIFSDLRTGTGTNRFLLVGATPTATSGLSLADNTASVVVLFDNNAVATGTNSANTFSNAAPTAAFVANVTVQTNTGVPNLSQVQATIEAPAAAATANRSRYTFVTLMNY